MAGLEVEQNALGTSITTPASGHDLRAGGTGCSLVRVEEATAITLISGSSSLGGIELIVIALIMDGHEVRKGGVIRLTTRLPSVWITFLTESE
jgi:hypothetical protein